MNNVIIQKNGMIFIRTALLALSIFLSSATLWADKCYDTMLLDGSEPLVDYGIDSTGHWWAVTQPFTDTYRLIIDGQRTDEYKEFSSLVFSPDGGGWAVFARDLVQWYLVTADSVMSLPGSGPGTIVYNAHGDQMVYSYMEAEMEIIKYRDKQMKVMNRTGELFVSNDARRIAFLGKRMDKYVININGQESTLYDEIKPIGFWYSGEMLYAALSGHSWEVFREKAKIDGGYNSITEVDINRFGEYAGYLGRMNNNSSVAVLLSDDYYEPLVGKEYDETFNLILHPEVPMISYQAVYGLNNFVVLNSTEYQTHLTSGPPYFTHDGDELYFVGCNIDCFININGRKYTLDNMLSTQLRYAVCPGSETFAYSTGSALVVQYLYKKDMHSGMMVDNTVQPIYDWREHRYVALGSIRNRLYKLTCRN